MLIVSGLRASGLVKLTLAAIRLCLLASEMPCPAIQAFVNS